MGIVAVLAAVVAAATAFAGWFFVQRARLNVEIDLDRSGFATIQVMGNVAGGPESEIRTGVGIVLRISNRSGRANSIVDIEMRRPVLHEPLPDGADFVTEVREIPNRLNKTMVDKVPIHWHIPGAWHLPHHLSPGELHEAGLTLLLTGDALPREDELPVAVTVTDVYGKRYRRKVRLKHE